MNSQVIILFQTKQVLLHRYAKEIAQLDLQNCQHWNRFLEVFFWHHHFFLSLKKCFSGFPPFFIFILFFLLHLENLSFTWHYRYTMIELARMACSAIKRLLYCLFPICLNVSLHWMPGETNGLHTRRLLLKETVFFLCEERCLTKLFVCVPLMLRMIVKRNLSAQIVRELLFLIDWPNMFYYFSDWRRRKGQKVRELIYL